MQISLGEIHAELRQEIENIESLTGLEELWLGKNKITELKVLSIPGRRYAYLTNNRTEYIIP